MNLATLKYKLRAFAVDALGYDIHKARDPYRDAKRLLTVPSPVIFDVGAHVGQTVTRLLKTFPTSSIHSFEPSRTSYDRLHAAHAGKPNVRLNNFGLAASAGTHDFFENEKSYMSSLMPPGPDACGRVTKNQVQISTIDSYCTEHGVERIDLLKSDTEGADLEVFKGARRMFEENRINLVLTEIHFSHIYSGAPRFDELFGFLADHSFEIVTFYQFFSQPDRVAYTDALFVKAR
jgi:FkbM family methyltransferase